MKIFSIIAMCAAVMLMLAGDVFAWPDTVVADRRYSGTITAMTPDSVTINTSSGEREVPAHEVQRISLDNEPAGLRDARVNALQGRMNDVSEQLDKIDSIPDNKFMRTEILFYRALSVTKLALSGESGTLKEAGSAANKFVNDPAAQESYHFYEGVELLGDLYMAIGRADGAETYYERILPSKNPATRLTALTKVADARTAQGKFDDALKAYDEATAIETEDTASRDAKLMAGVGRASCLAELDRAEEGIKFLDELIRNEDSQKTELFGRAYNAMGKCYLKLGKKKEALHSYLFTDVIFFSSPANHAEALYYLQQLWTDVGRADRARDAKQILNDRYQNTVWAQKLQTG